MKIGLVLGLTGFRVFGRVGNQATENVKNTVLTGPHFQFRMLGSAVGTSGLLKGAV